MIKRLVSLALSLLLAFALVSLEGVLAENTAEGPILCEIQNGAYVIHIPTAEHDPGWRAEAVNPQGEAAAIDGAEIQEGQFVVRFAPDQDGESTVNVYHFSGIACDRKYSWTLAVKDGAVQESIGGSYTASPAEEDQDPYLSGEWLERDTQFTRMRIVKNPDQGWDVEITSPMTHGAYVFRATMYFDCDQDAFIFENGAVFPLTSAGEPEEKPAEAEIKGGFWPEAGDGDSLTLVWRVNGSLETASGTRFERAEAENSGN